MKIFVLLALLVQVGVSLANVGSNEDSFNGVQNNEALVVDRVVPFDLLIGDIKPRDYRVIAQRLGSPPSLDLFHETKSFPVKRLVYGDQRRAFLPLAVGNDEEGVQESQDRTVLFLVNAGAPQTFLRPETMSALGCADKSPCRVMIHGYTVYAHICRHNFTNVDLLGTDYLSNIEATILVDYKAKTVVIDSKYMVGYEEL